MNAYASLTVFKRRLGISDTTDDADLLMLLVAGSRAIDGYCGRWFYVDATTRYYDGAGTRLFMDDLLAVTTLKLDEDGDATYESTLATTDYVLYPRNSWPKTYAKIATDSDYGSFASGILNGIEIAGNFGYGTGRSATPYSSSGGTVTVANGTSTSVTASDGTLFSAGQTILAGTEQMYIRSISSNTLTVWRGVNGTTAAAQSAATAYIYDYPEPIIEATLIQAMRWWKRKDTAFTITIASPEIGTVETYKGLDPDVKLIVDDHKKRIL